MTNIRFDRTEGAEAFGIGAKRPEPRRQPTGSPRGVEPMTQETVSGATSASDCAMTIVSA